MITRYSRQLFLILLGCTALVYGRQATRCSVCSGRLPEQYWTYEDKICCSPQCIDKLRPKCSRCSRAIDGQYMESDGSIYCSDYCFEQTLPKCEICRTPIHSGVSITRHHYCDDCTENSPTCFSCGLPAALPTELSDGRNVCNTCMRWSVSTKSMAQQHYERSIRYFETWTRLKLETVPKLELVDRVAMQKQSKDLRKTDTPVSIRGLYSRQTFMTKRGIFGAWKESPSHANETIYIVDHLHDEVFRVAVVHELMHDLIHEHFPRLKDAPLWVHEGICQQAAAEYCRRRNYIDILQGIESCTDPDYGHGYQYFNSIAGFEGWSALRSWMETVDVASLPTTAPQP